MARADDPPMSKGAQGREREEGVEERSSLRGQERHANPVPLRCGGEGGIRCKT